MGRDIKASGGRSFSKTCLVRGREGEGRMAILKGAGHNTRVAPIGPDGLTLDGAEKVPTADILDVRRHDETAKGLAGPIPGIVGDRGTVTMPTGVRRRLHLRPGSPVLIEVRDEVIVITPAEITPRRNETSPSLEAILAGVTAENRHDEFDTGDSVGMELL